jgi:hypothetical protein
VSTILSVTAAFATRRLTRVAPDGGWCIDEPPLVNASVSRIKTTGKIRRMQIAESELTAAGYRECGIVRPDPTPLHFVGQQGRGLFEVVISVPLKGWVTYVHVLNGEFKKAGKTENDESFAGRMKGSYTCLRKPIDMMNRGVLVHLNETLYYVDAASGSLSRPYEQDFPWKHRVPIALIARSTVALWARSHETRQAMLDEEDRLNLRYRGEWAKEGWSKMKAPDGRLLRTRIEASD